MHLCCYFLNEETRMGYGRVSWKRWKGVSVTGGLNILEVPACGSLTTVEQGRWLSTAKPAASTWPCSQSLLATCLLL